MECPSRCGMEAMWAFSNRYHHQVRSRSGTCPRRESNGDINFSVSGETERERGDSCLRRILSPLPFHIAPGKASPSFCAATASFALRPLVGWRRRRRVWLLSLLPRRRRSRRHLRQRACPRLRRPPAFPLAGVRLPQRAQGGRTDASAAAATAAAAERRRRNAFWAFPPRRLLSAAMDRWTRLLTRNLLYRGQMEF